MKTLTNTAAAVESLAAQLTGTVLAPAAAGWDAEIASFNCAVIHTPDLVIGAANAADVQAALNYAAAHGLAVGVQATGHGAVTAIDHGLPINTSRNGRRDCGANASSGPGVDRHHRRHALHRY